MRAWHTPRPLRALLPRWGILGAEQKLWKAFVGYVLLVALSLLLLELLSDVLFSDVLFSDEPEELADSPDLPLLLLELLPLPESVDGVGAVLVRA